MSDTPAPRCYFFGCWNEPGHFMFAPDKRFAHRSETRDLEHFTAARPEPVHLDGSLAPRCRPDGTIAFYAQGATRDECHRIIARSKECPQGQFLLHHLSTGFTAIQWWDRAQGDTRGACNSTILLEGMRTADEMIAALARHFPHVLDNLTRAGITLVEVKAST